MSKTLIFSFTLIFYLLGATSALPQEANITQQKHKLASIVIPLSYPQQSNTVRRPLEKTKPVTTIKGKIFVTVNGLSSEQQDSTTIYTEYFLDGGLVYSNEGKGKEVFGFILDTNLYPNGSHELFVNLWDSAGPSAIGKRRINIQNEN